MQKDAISAGVGSLVSSAEIKILICYVLKSVKAAVPGKQLASAFNYESIANYFEVIDALDALTKAGNLIYNAEDDTYTVTEVGASASETLKNSLPFTIREKAYAATCKIIARMRNSKEVDIVTVKENDQLYIVCSASDNGRTLMSVKLMVTDEIEAALIKERFLEKSSEIYSGLIDLITTDK